MSYNEVVNLLTTDFTLNDKEKEELSTEQQEQKKNEYINRQDILRKWLQDNAGQLTVFGLRQITDTLRSDELCIHFRNNHFACAIKHNNRFYHLVTDVGIVSAAPTVVWMKLAEANGDDQFVDSVK